MRITGSNDPIIASQLNQTFGDVTSQRTCFTGSIVTHVTVLWKRHTVLERFYFQLLKSAVA